MSSITNLPPVESPAPFTNASLQDLELERNADEIVEAMMKTLDAKYEEYQARLKQQG